MGKLTRYVLALLALALGACDFADGSDGGPSAQEDGLVAFTVYYGDPEARGRIAVAPFHNPHDYHIITPAAGSNGVPRFSPDKTQLTAADWTFRGEGSPPLHLVSVETQSVRHLPRSTRDMDFVETSAWSVVWMPDGDSFYMQSPCGIACSAWSSFYRLSDSTYTSSAGSFRTLTRIEADTLVVLVAFPVEERGLYLLDLNSEELTPFLNPHLSSPLVHVEHLTWSDKQRAFAFVKRGEVPRNRIIALTNLDGSYYQEYPSPGFVDGFPRWGPNGTVLFQRIRVEDEGNTYFYRLMLLDPATGIIEEFLSASALPGAVGLGDPDY